MARHRPGQHGRTHRRHRLRRDELLHLLRRIRNGWRLENHQQRHYFPANFRNVFGCIHWRYSYRSIESRHRLGWHWRSEQSPQCKLRRRHLQIHRRRKNFRAHGSRRFTNHRAHRHRSKRCKCRLRGRTRTLVRAEQDAGHLQDDRWRQNLEQCEVHR